MLGSLRSTWRASCSGATVSSPARPACLGTSRSMRPRADSWHAGQRRARRDAPRPGPAAQGHLCARAFTAKRPSLRCAQWLKQPRVTPCPGNPGTALGRPHVQRHSYCSVGSVRLCRDGPARAPDQAQPRWPFHSWSTGTAPQRAAAAAEDEWSLGAAADAGLQRTPSPHPACRAFVARAGRIDRPAQAAP
jgi:hypothetical protein